MDNRRKLIIGILLLTGLLYFARKPIESGVQTVVSAIRGVRNNNPLNIRYNKANPWIGQMGQDDSGFVIFDSPESGYRAAGKILLNYQKAGYHSINSMISRWAPENENPTAEYIAMVARDVGIDPNANIDLAKNPQILAAMLASMTKMESGVGLFSQASIDAGARRALV